MPKKPTEAIAETNSTGVDSTEQARSRGVLESIEPSGQRPLLGSTFEIRPGQAKVLVKAVVAGLEAIARLEMNESLGLSAKLLSDSTSLKCSEPFRT